MDQSLGVDGVILNRQHELLLMLIFGMITAAIWIDFYLELLEFGI